MVFSSTLFIFIFLPVTLLGCCIFRKKLTNYWLLAVSLVFFAWNQLDYLWIIVFNVVVNYIFAISIEKSGKYKKILIASAVAVNLAVLFYFKYFDFTITVVNDLFHSSISLKNIVLPIGISFFTFQGLSYVIDVYRGTVSAQKNPCKLALYITLFPQLIAGPIVRYKDVADEIECRTVTMDDFVYGIERFIIGLSKKAILANTLAVLVDGVWNNGADSNLWDVAWVATIAYMLQIYYDFSGYSDMAIGLGRMFGFHFLENFNLPYTCNSINEYWKRWHLSLSSWFRDYVYFPLGGNRRHVYLNIAIVFILTGIWHGASWTFILWGIWNGIFVIAEKFVKNYCRKRELKVNVPIVVRKFYALLTINFSLILFRAETLEDAYNFFLSLFGVVDYSKVGYTLFWYLDRWTLLILALSILFASSIPQKIGKRVENALGNKTVGVKYALLIMLFAISIVRIVSGTYNPFIYFQF